MIYSFVATSVMTSKPFGEFNSCSLSIPFIIFICPTNKYRDNTDARKSEIGIDIHTPVNPNRLGNMSSAGTRNNI